MNYSVFTHFKPGRLGFFILVFFFVTTFTLLFIAPIGVGGAVAIVNGKQISKSSYEKQLKSQEYFITKVFASQDKPVPDYLIKGLPQSVLSNLILEELLTQYLAQKGVVITDEQLLDYLQKNIVDKKYSGSWQEYEDFLTKNKNTLQNILSQVKRELLIGKVLEIEGIDVLNFDSWYANLKSRSKVSVVNSE